MKFQPLQCRPQSATDRATRTCRVLVVSLVLTTSTSSLPAQSTHRDADGCYTLTVPAGWRAAQNDRGTLLSAPNAGMLITAGPPRRAESVRGKETFDDPVRGEPVELPSNHNHAWVSRGGEYILTDNPNFNPNVEASGTWVEMKPTK